MAATDKDTIYIDIDDEITGIIDKLKASDGKIVALVLPKRAATFQSIVNMKLLKRAADSSNKHLVLITSEAGLLPLAGAAGVHVAKTLTSKPEIPSGPDGADDQEETVDEAGEDLEVTKEADGDKPVSALTGAAPLAAADGVETLELDDEDLPPEAAAVKTKDFTPPKKGKKGAKDKKLHVPNFERFRLLLLIGGLVLLLLIIGFIFASIRLPKATITIKTDAQNLDVNADLTLSTTAKSLSGSDNTTPAKLAQIQKTYTQQVATTGQKNNGNKASGTVTVTNCSHSDDGVYIAAGAGFSSNGNTYISQSSITVPSSKFTGSNKCANDTGKASVEVIAQSPGTAYNLPGNASFTVAGTPSGVTASGGTISGGTDSIVQSVNQNDINSAKAKISASDSEVKSTLKSQLKTENYFAIDSTFTPGTPNVTNSANVGDVASTVTVTETISYTMFGAHQDDLKSIIKDSLDSQIDSSKQSILDDGLSSAVFNVDNISATGAQLSMSTRAVVGPDLNEDTIKQKAAGQHAGQIKSDLGSNPDVKSVDVKLSPFWVSTVPKKTERITVNIAKPTTTSASQSSSDGQ